MVSVLIVCVAIKCEPAHNVGTMKTQDVIDFFGSREKVAEALGIESVSSISHWKEYVPLLRQYQIEVLTKGALTASGVSTVDQPSVAK